MIKRIACLATLLGDARGSHYSELVFSAFESARIYNKENNINGSFLVRENAILQILEGSSDALANIIYRINRDPKIASASIILNKEIAKPVFSRWSIKLLDDDPAHHTPYIKKLHALLQPDLNISSKDDIARFNYIFEFESSADVPAQNNPSSPLAETNTASQGRFDDALLSMSSWPSPTKLRLTADLMKISSILIGHSVTYHRLRELELLPSEHQLQDTLNLLYDAGALNIETSSSPDNLAFINESKPQSPPTKSSRRFSSALKKFIGAQRLRGV